MSQQPSTIQITQGEAELEQEKQELADLIRRILDATGLTQDQLGDRIGVDSGSMSRYKSGKHIPNAIYYRRLQKIALAAGVPLFNTSAKPDMSGQLKRILVKARKFFRIKVEESQRDEVICDTEHGMEDCSTVIKAYERYSGATVSYPTPRPLPVTVLPSDVRVIQHAAPLKVTKLSRADAALVLRTMGYEIDDSQNLDDNDETSPNRATNQRTSI